MTDSDIIREALRLLCQREELRALRLQKLQLEVHHGLDQIEAGRVKPLSAVAIKASARQRTG